MKISAVVLTSIVFISLSVSANATLFVRGEGTHDDANHYKLIYDDVYDVTWYDYNWDLERYSWDEAFVSADSLLVDFDGKKISDWRLSSAIYPDGVELEGRMGGYYAADYIKNIGEIGSLWGQHEEGGYYDIDGNFQTGSPLDYFSDYDIWTNTKIEIPNQDIFLRFEVGYEGDWVGYFSEPDWANSRMYLARSGDVAAVPEPATMLVFATGLIGLVGARCRRKKK